MRLSLRFVLPLLLALATFAWAAVPLTDALMQRWFVRDLDMRSSLIAATVQEPLSALIGADATGRMTTLFNRLIQDERLYAVGLCLPGRTDAISTFTFPPEIRCAALMVSPVATERMLRTAHGLLHVAVRDVETAPSAGGRLVLVHDMSFVERRSADTRKYIIILFAVLGIVISLITVFVAHLSWRGWIEGVRAMLRGEGIVRPFSRQAPSSELQPLVGDLRALLAHAGRRASFRRRHHHRLEPGVPARAAPPAAASENGSSSFQTASLTSTYEEGTISRCTVRPAAWSPPWNRSCAPARAPGSPTAAVPPTARPWTGMTAFGCRPKTRNTRCAGSGSPRKRKRATTTVSPMKDSGRSAISPMCGRCSAPATGEQYVAINQRFADAVVKEADSDDPVVLVQDYHFALLPGMIRKSLPKATIITFWHIPWPNPESFGICPWREELLQGMLGSTILGFHTPFHCKNFLETVDRYLETRDRT